MYWDQELHMMKSGLHCPRLARGRDVLGSHAVVYNNRQRVRFSDGIEHVEDLIRDLLPLVSVH